MDPITILVLAAYASLALELVVFAVPSEASTVQLLRADGDVDGSPAALSTARQRNRISKALRYALPTTLGIVLFLIPLVVVFWPGLLAYLWPIDAKAPWLGAGLIVCGRLVTITAALQLRHKTDDLQPGGLFGLSRNPILLGMYLFYLGNCCIFPSLVLWVGFVPYTLNMHNRVLMEESHLATRLGTSYENYLRQVPRYLLFR